MGQRFEILNSPLDVQSSEARAKTLLLSAIAHVNLNSLPKALSDELAARGWAHRTTYALLAWVDSEPMKNEMFFALARAIHASFKRRAQGLLDLSAEAADAPSCGAS